MLFAKWFLGMDKIKRINLVILLFHALLYFVFLILIGDWARLGFLWGSALVVFMMGYGVAPWVWFYCKGGLLHKGSAFWCLLLIALSWCIFYEGILSSTPSEPLLLAVVPIYTFLLNGLYLFLLKIFQIR